ncbi:MAG: hypothetical protein ACR2HH_10465 [Chthoniobacterales bacterium]
MELPSASSDSGARSWWQTFRAWDWTTIAVVLVIKAVLLTYAVQSLVTLGKDYRGWMDIWNRWDAIHYLRLAQFGYVATGEERFDLVFFPLYPWSVRAVALVVKNFSAAAFLVSGLASIAVGLLLKQLTRLDHSAEVAQNAVWFLFIFPTSYFLHIAYTEGFFLALSLGCFLAVRKQSWLLAGVLGALACLTRVTGLILLPALATEVYLQYRAARRIDFRWLWLGLIPLGFAGYLLLNYQVTGDALAFTNFQREHWFKQFAAPWFGVADVWRRIPGENAMEGAHEFFYIAFGFVCCLWCAWRLRASYTVWMFGSWLLVNSTSFVVSVPRYTLTLFPIFILLAQWCTGRRVPYALVSVFSLLYLALYAGRFAQGYWAF